MFVFVTSLLLLIVSGLSEQTGLTNINIIEIANNQRNIMRNMIGQFNSSALNASNFIQSKMSSVENQVTLHTQHKMNQIQTLLEATANDTLDSYNSQPDEVVHQQGPNQLPPKPDIRKPTSEPDYTESVRGIKIPTVYYASPMVTKPVACFRNPIYFRSCQEIYVEGFDISGMYIIDPDLDGEIESYFVYCSMTHGQGVTLVLIGEELEMPIEVHGDNRPGSFVYEPTYEPTFQQMAALVEISNTCQQYIQYTCQGSKLLAFHHRYGKHRGWLVSRDDEVVISWGGAPVNSTSCECGITDSCITEHTKCNCDGPSSVEADQTDAGYMTDKNILPIKRVYLGDAAGSKTAYLTLGGLECSG
ncbi:contactin-associated protein-like 2 [Anneissia japonica]|uniref:contactin-associated protein-like 2 n=1 Tax=Anneissia japonica TaxID=1529436 RepID=UPI001425ADE6|nr:contactin-associated protein-like 2 [Anneissia japonica]